ncbi:MAG TPA: LLM class flavin-dependent oxidoreductase [Candidatus Binataceae bacterium]|nr:LLM class flavin-dependent oxidoreductase [Candidatus Binataceae bacterium]
MAAVNRVSNTSLSDRIPRLTEEPEIVKFVRIDAAQWEWDWAPEAYDPLKAKALFDSHLEEALEAEALGFDGLFLTEHHFDGWTVLPSPNIFLTALAMKTTRLRLGAGVHVLSIHSPIRLAEEAGMIDLLSNGRVEVGLGKGNFQFEWDRYTPPRSEADARFDENFELFRKALTESSFTFEGKWNRIAKPSTIYPKPLQNPLPVWIAGSSPDSVVKVGKLGQNLASAGTPDGGERFERYLEAARKAGHEFSGANYMIVTSTIIAPTDQEARRIAERNREIMINTFERRGYTMDSPDLVNTLPFFSGALVGSPSTVRDQLIYLLNDTRARRLIVNLRFRGITSEASRQSQRLFATEVIPHLRHHPIR